jgi:Arc/MetJ family transcription regulator
MGGGLITHDDAKSEHRRMVERMSDMELADLYGAASTANPVTADNVDVDDDLWAHVNRRLGVRQQRLSSLDRKSVKKMSDAELVNLFGEDSTREGIDDGVEGEVWRSVQKAANAVGAAAIGEYL